MAKKIIIVQIFILAAIAAFYYWPKTQPAKHVVTGPPQDIRVGNIGEYSVFNIIAKEKGYFSDNGLNAQVTEYASGPAAMQGLLSGELDVTVAADFVGVRNIFSNPDLRIMSEVSKQEAFYLVARKDKGILTPADLKGKKVGVTRKGAGEFFLGQFLNLNDLTLSDIKVYDLTPGEMSSQLQSGSLDAVVIFDPHAYNLTKSLGQQAISWSAQSEEKTFALVYSTGAFINSHPDTVERYMRALMEAEQFVKSNPEESQKIVAQYMHYTTQYVSYMWQNIHFHLSLDQELLVDMENQANWAIGNKLTTASQVPNYLNYIYFPVLEKLKPESTTIIH